MLNELKEKLEKQEEKKIIYDENKEQRNENEENRLELYDCRKDNKEMFKELSLKVDLVESFDYRKSNSVSIIRQIKEVIMSSQTK